MGQLAVFVFSAYYELAGCLHSGSHWYNGTLKCRKLVFECGNWEALSTERYDVAISEQECSFDIRAVIYVAQHWNSQRWAAC